MMMCVYCYVDRLYFGGVANLYFGELCCRWSSHGSYYV